MKLFHVTFDGFVTYWIAAEALDDCLPLILATEGLTEEDGPDECVTEETDPATVKDEMIRDDDSTHESGKTSLEKLFAETTIPSVIACSEY